MTENLAEDLDELARGLDRDHVFHSWSAQSQLSSLVVASGRGCRVWDHAGREYVDQALENLEADGVDILGADYEPTEVTLEEGGN